MICASFFVSAQPLTARVAASETGPMIVPGSSLKLALLRTWIGTLNFLPNSIERLCITPAPRLASSRISSCDTRSIFRASATSRGSVVKTPSTSVYISQASAFSTAASATAVVSLPPRPRVVMFKSSSIP